jgi:hypothetical protein
VVALADDPISQKPPCLLVRRRRSLPQLGPGALPRVGHAQMRSHAKLEFHGREVLHVKARDPAQVLHEMDHELG